MSASVFDTLAYAKKLKLAGVPEAQAEVHAEAMVELVEERLATKRDLKELEERLNNQMRAMEERLNSKMQSMEERFNSKMQSMDERLNTRMQELEYKTQELEYKLTVRLGSTMVVAVGLVATLVKLL